MPLPISPIARPTTWVSSTTTRLPSPCTEPAEPWGATASPAFQGQGHQLLQGAESAQFPIPGFHQVEGGNAPGLHTQQLAPVS